MPFLRVLDSRWPPRKYTTMLYSDCCHETITPAFCKLFNQVRLVIIAALLLAVKHRKRLYLHEKFTAQPLAFIHALTELCVPLQFSSPFQSPHYKTWISNSCKQAPRRPQHASSTRQTREESKWPASCPSQASSSWSRACSWPPTPPTRREGRSLHQRRRRSPSSSGTAALTSVPISALTVMRIVLLEKLERMQPKNIASTDRGELVSLRCCPIQ
jgi:hypothetical protein